MRVIEIAEAGAPDVLRLSERVRPEPAYGEILIKVAYAGVNRPDALQRAGAYAPPKGASDLPGLEASGEVAALGEGVSEWAVGDKVCALLPGGGYAEYVTTPAAHALPVPEGMSLKQAACLPETFFTVWTNVFDAGALKPGERFLVHGGASGIGTTAIQMAKAHGASVIATAGGPDRAQLCRDLGADRAFDYHAEDWSAAISAEGGADVILDMVGGDYVQKNLNCLNRLGCIVMIAFLKGSRVEVDLMGLMLKRQTLTGSTLRARPDAEKAAIAQAVQTHVWPWIEAGKVRPRVDSTFALDEVSKAHARMDSGGHAGKILLVP